MSLTIFDATPDRVWWHRPDSPAQVSTTREAVEDALRQIANDEPVRGVLAITDETDLSAMRTAMEARAQEAYDVRMETLHERAADFDSNFRDAS